MIDELRLKLFYETMYERQEIFYKRNLQKNFHFENSEDEILRDYKFTNVYRELDRNSQYLIRYAIMDDSLSLKNILLRIMIFRLFNKIETFDLIGFPLYETFDLKEFQQIVREVESEGFETANTGSYLVNTWLCKGLKAGVAYSERILPSILENIDLIANFCMKSDVKNLIKQMKKVNGIGNFISYEWFIDICYINKYNKKYEFKFDENSYLNVGPGAAEGINKLVEGLTRSQQTELIHILRDESKIFLPEDFKYIKWDKRNGNYDVVSENNITLHQIEMWLCEYNKYCKMLMKKGKQRKPYRASQNKDFYLY